GEHTMTRWYKHAAFLVAWLGCSVMGHAQNEIPSPVGAARMVEPLGIPQPPGPASQPGPFPNGAPPMPMPPGGPHAMGHPGGHGHGHKHGPMMQPPLIPGPITPQMAPLGPPPSLSLPANHTSAFDREKCPPEEAFFASIGIQGLQRG